VTMIDEFEGNPAPLCEACGLPLNQHWRGRPCLGIRSLDELKQQQMTDPVEAGTEITLEGSDHGG
jgi:hypothetical protein